MKKIKILTLIAIASIAISASVTSDLQIKSVDPDRLKFFPVPEDNKNYFFLQSIDNVTKIIIGDFTEPEKRIILITLANDYKTIQSVIEYNPVTEELRSIKSSPSKFFTTDTEGLKRAIIEGTIFKNNYTDPMRSLDVLKAVLNRKEKYSIIADTYGYNVKFADIDDRRKHSAIFSYGKTEKGYYLLFKTEFYREGFASLRQPILPYSVYCKNTNDPIIKEIVEDLFKIKAPVSVKVDK